MNHCLRFHRLITARNLAIILWLTLSAPACSDGLGDMKIALNRLLIPATAFKGMLEVKTAEHSGDGGETRDHLGQVSALVNDNHNGLQFLLSPESLARADAEREARSIDPNALEPTISTLHEINAANLAVLVNSATDIMRVLKEATFKEEHPDIYNGKPARVLRFEYPIAWLKDDDRKYVNKFSMMAYFWIGADGTPLASKVTEQSSGRAFVILSFEQKVDREYTYALCGDRLYVSNMTSVELNAGAGARKQRKVTQLLHLL